MTSVTEVVRLRAPLTPVMVSTKLPVGVVAAVVTVNVEEFAVAGFGLKVPVAPAGNPLTLKVTPPVNPPKREMFAVYDVLPPRMTVWEAGVAERPKSGTGAALTTRETEVVCVRLPLVPVIVTEKLPVGVPAPVLTDIVAEPVAGFGLKLARSEEHTSELQSRPHLVCRLLRDK